MVVLSEVAIKLQNILNGIDAEIVGLQRDTDLFFKVETEGYHLDTIADNQTHKNFIPVFISSMGGQYNAIPDFKEASFNIPVVIYFPVRFKDDFFRINDYLVDCFVGKLNDYGTQSGKCLSNISVAQFGEIVGLDLQQFQQWVGNIYNKKIDVMEKWMSMTFTLYLTSIESGAIYSNSVKYKMSIDDYNVKYITRTTSPDNKLIRDTSRDKEFDGVKHYYWSSSVFSRYTTSETPEVNDHLYWIIRVGETETIYDTGEVIGTIEYGVLKTYSQYLKWTSSGTGASISPIAQQLIDQDKFVKNTMNTASYNKSINAFITNTEFWQFLLNKYNLQDTDAMDHVRLTKEYGEPISKTYEYNQVALQLNENIVLGEPLSMTITFGDK